MESFNIPNHIDLESGKDSGDDRRNCPSSGEKGGSSSLLSDNSDGHSSSEELNHVGPEILGVTECSVELDLDAGEEKNNSHLVKSERDCRICHLTLDDSNQESGFPIELWCSCKNDLAVAHKQCAEAWFKIKGNRICEICGSIARNVSGPYETELSEQWDEENAAAVAATTPGPIGEAQYFWQGHRFLNSLLACMVFAFVISWLFHFNVPS